MFGVSEGFDVVIGNPPYVRQEVLGIEYKRKLKSIFPEIANGIADLYIYFFGLALKELKENGISIFITPNKFLKTKYGIELRNTLVNYDVDKIIDFFELPVFEAANDTSISIIKKIRNNNITKYFPVRSLVNLDLNKITKENYYITQKNKTEWIFVNDIQHIILKKLYDKSVTLKEFANDKIFRGITTGLNEVFVLEKEIADHLLKTESKKIVKHYTQSIDIKKWNILDQSRFFLATGYELDISKLYPSAYNYLKTFEKPLKKRLDKGKNWWNLRACKYYDEFEKPKIIYMHTAKKHEFYLDTEGYYINNSCYMIISDNKFLFCFLNSKLFEWFKKLKFVAYGDADNSGRCKLDYNKMITVPIKDISINSQQPFITLVDQIISKKSKGEDTTALENEIDVMVYKLYELTYDEVKIVDPEFWMSEGEYGSIKN